MPFCGHHDTQVVETRDSDGDSTRRRRRCQSCDKRFTTYERAEIELPVIVKRDGRRTDYDRAKLRGSLLIALRKRPVGPKPWKAPLKASKPACANVATKGFVYPVGRVGDAGTP